MKVKKLTIVAAGLIVEKHENTAIITFDGFAYLVKSGKFLKFLCKYSEIRLIAYRLDVIPKPFTVALLIKLLCRGNCYFEDDNGNRQKLTLPFILGLFVDFMRDLIRKPLLLRWVKKEIATLASTPEKKIKLDLSRSPAYFRTDMAFGIKAGGSVGHIAGVINNLARFTGAPIILASDTMYGISPEINSNIIEPGTSFWDFRELPAMNYNRSFEKQAIDILNNKKLAFIYQRYSLNNFIGIKIARRYEVPFVLEYNGSEVWVAKNWGRRLKYEKIASKIEMLNLEAAEVIVVVSQVMKDDLLELGIEDEKILVNPNGVDTDTFSPDIDGMPIRQKYELEDNIVIGFIGTFGRWHGAEALAKAVKPVTDQNPDVRFLFVGDGHTMPEVKTQLKRDGVEDKVILTGMVPQAEGPSHLAACDVLVSPHVPNEDGTKFFGSPTKLFEYMAIGKPIVASNLDQIGDILSKESAILVEPGDVGELIEAIKLAIGDADLRERLGKQARLDVMDKYTWKQNVERVVDYLISREATVSKIVEK